MHVGFMYVHLLPKIGNGNLWHFTCEAKNSFQCLLSKRSTRAVALKHLLPKISYVMILHYVLFVTGD